MNEMNLEATEDEPAPGTTEVDINTHPNGRAIKPTEQQLIDEFAFFKAHYSESQFPNIIKLVEKGSFLCVTLTVT